MQITGRTILLGLLGWPVGHSLSPAMHNAALAAAGIDGVYLPLPLAPARLADGVRGLAALGFRGVNVTIPHKQTVMPYLDSVDAPAQAIGAVNTIVFGAAGGAHGSNTDWRGFLADLAAHGVDPAGRACAVLGAGGSARAVAYALIKQRADVHIFARNIAQADQLVQQLVQTTAYPHIHSGYLQDLAMLSTDWGVIVNSTPLGMGSLADRSPWPATQPLPAGAFVYDLVYNPSVTPLLAQAQAAGVAYANGLGMLLHQGAQAFEQWLGVAPDLAVMRAALATA